MLALDAALARIAIGALRVAIGALRVPLHASGRWLQNIAHRLVDHAGPVVVEGIMVLDALGAIGRKPDFLIHLDGKGGRLLSSRLATYRARHHPEQRADFRLQGFAD